MTQEVLVTSNNEYGYSGDNLFYECYVQYQIGGGEKGDFHVNANALNLNWVRQGNLTYNKEKNIYSLNLVSTQFGHRMFSSEALALGNINLTKIGDEIFRINNDRYDFDMHWNENRWDNGYFTFRNVFTTGAGLLHGNTFDNQPLPIIGNTTISSQFGGPFKIKFHGTIRIKK